MYGITLEQKQEVASVYRRSRWGLKLSAARARLSLLSPCSHNVKNGTITHWGNYLV